MWNYRRVNNWSLLHVFGYFVAIKRPKSPWEAGNGGVLLANLCCTADRTLCFVPVLGTPLIWEHHHIFWDGKRHDLNPSTPAGAVGVPNLWLKFQWITGKPCFTSFASLKCIAFLAPRTFDSWACASKMPTPLACPVIPQFCWRPSCVAQSRSPKKFVGQKPPLLPGVKNSHTWEWGLLITPDSGNSSNVVNEMRQTSSNVEAEENTQTFTDKCTGHSMHV